MSQTPKTNKAESFHYPRLSELSRNFILDDFFAMFSVNNYIAVILKNASREELLFLAKALEKKILGLKGGEVISKYDKKYNLDSLIGFQPTLIPYLNGYDADTMRESIKKLGSACEKSLYLVIDDKNQFNPTISFGFYFIDVGYFLGNQSPP